MRPAARPHPLSRAGTDPALVVLVFLVVGSFLAGAVVGVALAAARRAPTPAPVRVECLCARAGAP